MHSVLVIGDVRTHKVKTLDGEEHTINGGAFMMNNAVIDALDTLDAIDRPTVFSFSPRPDPTVGLEALEWTLKSSQAADDRGRSGQYGDKSRLRLEKNAKPTAKPTGYGKLDFAENLLKALGPFDVKRLGKNDSILPSGYFETSLDHDGIPFCPDLLVIDDLTQKDESVESALPGLPFGNIQTSKLLKDLRVAPRDKSVDAKAYFQSLWTQVDGLGKGEKSDGITRLQRCVDILANRLLIAAQFIHERPGNPMEPVIIASIAGKQLPKLTCSLDDKPTIWQCLHSEKELRSRTVVLMNVEDLRQHEGLGISTGLSWERTAQETITELHRKPRLKEYLKFGTVIVRFGATGALQIVRQEYGGWSYRLYFDPNRDDQTYSDSDDSNHVLGYTSVFAATLVEELTRKCNQDGKKPIVNNIPHAIAQAIPRAISRCQIVFERGYGDSTASFWPGQFEKPFGKECFELGPDSDADAMPAISQLDVPELFMPDWSILSQSAQLNMGQIAKDIVLWGVDTALNRYVPKQARLVQILKETCLDLCWKRVEKCEFDGTPTNWKGLVPQLIKEVRTQVLERTTRLPSELHDRCLKSSNKAWEKTSEFLGLQLETMALGLKGGAAYRVSSTPRDDFQRHIDVYGAALCGDDSFLDEIQEQFAAPVLRYKPDFTVVDRTEIEGIRSIYKLIKEYIKDCEPPKPTPDIPHPVAEKQPPLAIAVFGPPGSGKSTAVKSIVQSLAGDKTEQLTYNLAEYTSSDQLEGAFKSVVKVRDKNKIAVAFFDEFDARYSTEPWGWLKFFLAPMEDKVFRGEAVRNSIFVFAGGTSPTYEQFALVGRPPTDPQAQDFARAKGPDFISRLSGYLNVVGVNPSGPSDRLYLIRRAVVIRHFLKKIQSLGEHGKARIDEDMLRAILFVTKYLNNTRSVRKMLEQCSKAPGRRVAKSSVPLAQQLDMLTDAKDFMDKLANVASDVRT